MMLGYDSRMIHKLSIWRFVAGLWPLLLTFILAQWAVRTFGNTAEIAIPWWLSLSDLIVFMAAFVGAAIWVYTPLAQMRHVSLASSLECKKLEERIIDLQSRAMKGFLIAGMACAFYLLAVLSVGALVSNAALTPTMLLASALCLLYSVGILAPCLAFAMTMAYMVKLRHSLGSEGLFLHGIYDGDVNIMHWSHVARRPWLIFLLTSALPASILAFFVYLILGTATQVEQHFILLQAGTLFVALTLAGTWLVFTVGQLIEQVMKSMTDGLERIKEGELDFRVPILTDDEFGILARGLNTAAAGLQEREELKHGLEIAVEIHHAMLPSVVPDIERYSLHSFQKSCYAVGGDYYDHIVLPDGRLWLIVADVAGKGYPAALTVANLRAMLHALAHLEIPFEKAAAYVNNTLCETLTGGRFVTLFMAKLQPESNSLLWLNAGHMPALLYRQGEIEALEASSPPMGLQKDLDFKVSIRMLQEGDTLLAYSDGVTEERHHGSNEMFGGLRLKQWLSEHGGGATIEKLSQQLQEKLDDYGHIAADDDVTMLFVRREL